MIVGPSYSLQHEHPLQVPGHNHEIPLAFDFVQPAQQKLTESEHGLDNAEHRLGSVFAQGVKFLAFGRLQAVGHGLDRRWIFWRSRSRGEALAQGWMMRVPAHGEQRLDRGRLARLYIGLAEVTVVAQQRFDLAQLFGRALVLASIGSSCCLSLGD